MAKVKHYIKDGKIIRETKTGNSVTHDEISEEEFNRYQVGQSKNGFIWLTALFLIVIVFLYTIFSQF
ncbi:hypothetical protein AC622_12150 [Bacillus sp. FJAT-27916]|uniref:hypothetical protein n=1 Tax=Bacillus sp. FJAT-27916 TaxID=1679169 RepID=UPI00067087EF|nr:hypothetical protein [Bacillus sp. FJAT-27916]KMY44876.1 hypothetical protein AC622_12150 [Bacillus sp. FJAT-27916]